MSTHIQYGKINFVNFCYISQSPVILKMGQGHKLNNRYL